MVNPVRRARAENDFRFFCETYFSAPSPSPGPGPPEGHRQDRAGRAAGGLFAHAMPRGSGKTTSTSVACIWAILTRAIAPSYASSAARPSEPGPCWLTSKQNSNQSAPAGRFPEVVYPDPVSSTGSPTGSLANSTRRIHPDRLDSGQDRPADHPRQQSERSRHDQCRE